MKIGSQAHHSSAISTSNETNIVVRGRDLSGELIGRIDFTEHFWLLLTGVLPTAAQRRVLDATLVAIAEHGLVPSVLRPNSPATDASIPVRRESRTTRH